MLFRSFNTSGSAICFFTDLYVDRSWHLRDSGQVTIHLPKTNVKATAANLAYGNRVLIENANLQNWVGFLWPPRQEDYSAFSVTALSAERLMDMRITGVSDALSGSAGSIASQLMTIANSIAQTGVTVSSSDVDSTGDSLSKTYHFDNIYAALNTLAKESNMFWWVNGVRNATTGLLEMSFHWGAARGVTWGYQLEQGFNFKIENYIEEGSPTSSVTVYGKGTSPDWSDVPYSTITDAVALATYGLVQKAVASLDSEDAGTTATVAAALAAQASLLRREADGEVNVSPFPAIGDSVRVLLKNFAFGLTATMRVYDCAWDSRQALLKVKMRETV